MVLTGHVGWFLTMRWALAKPFTSEEAKAQRGDVTCPKHTATPWQSREPDTGRVSVKAAVCLGGLLVMVEVLTAS